ncbi:ABC transporter substrate-binding protein [Holospora curviuscula]|uniref:Arginine-binding extracellular protein ArtP n=1 Tax=Holospora curviuscula TaxID=1082868 RepID=A0A2S5R8K6_9PROT|nr:ABC transporter substrate-binding protein [Holospora curviuscula]PPE03512.1 Arginine-binding extracellular protein ArtP precursor [Holospora curviuscula]
MKLRFKQWKCLLLSLLSIETLCIIGCTSKKNSQLSQNITVVTCADYPPFEYYTAERNLEGFDIELIQLIAKILKKKVHFEVLEFSGILAALETHRADVGIATISITQERQKQFKFSKPYYTQVLYALFRKGDSKKFSGKILGCQMGTTMEDWIKIHHPKEQCVIMDENLPLVEALKAKKIDLIVLDAYQAKEFCQMNPELQRVPLGKSTSSYGIVFPKNSVLCEAVNAALEELEQSGALQKLKYKYHIE